MRSSTREVFGNSLMFGSAEFKDLLHKYFGRKPLIKLVLLLVLLTAFHVFNKIWLLKKALSHILTQMFQTIMMEKDVTQWSLKQTLAIKERLLCRTGPDMLATQITTICLMSFIIRGSTVPNPKA